MEPSFTGVGDTMPSGRTKWIHRVAVHGKVEFVPGDNSAGYTGMFE